MHFETMRTTHTKKSTPGTGEDRRETFGSQLETEQAKLHRSLFTDYKTDGYSRPQCADSRASELVNCHKELPISTIMKFAFRPGRLVFDGAQR